MEKPKLEDYIKTVFIDHKGTYGDKGKRYGGIDFGEYAFTLEKYVRYLESLNCIDQHGNKTKPT